MVMTYSALEVARYIIHHEAQQGRTVSNLRLQKLLYFVQAQFVVNATDGQPCFKDRMEAWDFGPVVPKVYRAYRYYGSAVIPYDDCEQTSISSADGHLIDAMLNHCAKYSTPALVDITHAQDPWKNAYRNGFDNEITPAAIRTYFKGE